MNFIAKVLAHYIVKVKEKKPRKRWLLTDIMDMPEDYMLMAYIENDELVVKVRKKDV